MISSARPPFPPIEPPPTRVVFPNPRALGDEDIVAVGTDFRPGTLLRSYRTGIFPWPHGDDLVAWFSPDPRAIFPLRSHGAHPWSRSLRRTLRLHPFEITRNQAFAEVVNACGATRSEGTWIIPELIDGYVNLHQLGWAHSLEVWEKGTPRTLVGGIYGVAIGGLFAGESMFHLRTDASKIAFAHLVAHLQERGFSLFDVQVENPHLLSLGCIEIPRSEYLNRLETALTLNPEF